MSELKITETITISNVPGLEEIQIVPTGANGGAEPLITTAATLRLDYDMDARHAQGWGIAELKQMREALDIAITRAEQMMAAEQSPIPVHSSGFRLGQVLTGDEDLPIGTVAEDSDPSGPDSWTYRGDLWETTDGDTVSVQHWYGMIERYGPVTIVSLP